MSDTINTVLEIIKLLFGFVVDLVTENWILMVIVLIPLIGWILSLIMGKKG